MPQQRGDQPMITLCLTDKEIGYLVYLLAEKAKDNSDYAEIKKCVNLRELIMNDWRCQREGEKNESSR